jgi:ABC-type Zn2+ transport system substrate-binding protein/surface adhesin
MRTNDRTAAEKFAKIAIDLIHDSEFVRKAEDFNTRKSKIEGNLKTFDETLDYIAKDLEQTDKPLKGKCWLCKRIMKIF